MVAVDDERVLRGARVVRGALDAGDQGVSFQVVRGLASHVRRPSFRVVRDDVPVVHRVGQLGVLELEDHVALAVVAGVRVREELLREVRRGEDFVLEARGSQFFVRGVLHVSAPLPVYFLLGEIVQWPGDEGEVLDRVLVLNAEAEDSPQAGDVLGRGHRLDWLEIVRGVLDAVARDRPAVELNFVLAEARLRCFE